MSYKPQWCPLCGWSCYNPKEGYAIIATGALLLTLFGTVAFFLFR